MTTLAFFGEPRMPRLSRLLQEIQRGEILVPRFQRPFVWSDEQRVALLESVYSGFPIGAILVWRTQKHRLVTYDHLGPLRLPPAPEGETTRQYLLDGHQRMATLFAALGPGLYARDDQGTPAWHPEDEGEQASWPIYFDLSAEQEPFRLPGKRPRLEPHWLPLDKLFNSYALVELKEQLKAQGYDRGIINRVDAVADTFRDYLVPVMPIATEDLAQVTVSFKRVNSGGTQMSEVHMVNALLHGRQFDLMQELEKLAAELKLVGWETFEPQMILNVCKARMGLPLYEGDAETIAKEFPKHPGILHAVRDDIIRAAEVLDKMAGVRSPASLPYSYQAVLLADALRGAPPPSEALLQKLRLWFWSTTLTEYFRGMTSSLFKRARTHLRELVQEQAEPHPPDQSRVVDAIGRFDFRGARSRTIGLLLAELKPVDPSDQPGDPFDLLAQLGVDALSKLLVERDAPGMSEELNGPGNRFLIAPRSVRGLRTLLDAPEWLANEQAFASHAINRTRAAIHGSIWLADERRLATHAITRPAIDALRKQQWGEFLRLRRKTIEGLERDRAEECGLEYRTES